MASKVLILVDSLPNTNDKAAILNDINVYLSSTQGDALKELVPNVSFDVMFECLQTDNR